jgi:hypothetical protein
MNYTITVGPASQQDNRTSAGQETQLVESLGASYKAETPERAIAMALENYAAQRGPISGPFIVAIDPRRRRPPV